MASYYNGPALYWMVARLRWIASEQDHRVVRDDDTPSLVGRRVALGLLVDVRKEA